MAKKSTSKKVKKAAKKHPKLLIAIIILVAVIAAVLVAVYFIKPSLYHKFIGLGEHEWGEWEVTEPATCTVSGIRKHTCTVCGKSESEEYLKEHTLGEDNICTVCGFDANFVGSWEEAASSDFSVHVIDLGKYAGDSIYIKAGENDILIDAGSRAESATLICEYLNGYVTDNKLEYVIATHADQDHIAAFAGSKKGSAHTGVLYNFKVDTLIKFDNVEESKIDKKDDTSTVFGKFNEAVNYTLSQGTDVFTGGQCYREEGGAKRRYELNADGTLCMSVLYNYYYDHVSGDENNHSVVTLFTKKTPARDVNYLFTGDLEKEGEQKLAEYYSDPSNCKSEYDVLPEVDFYKAGHHGSGTSSSPELLNIIKPKYVAVSCCAGSPEYTLNSANTFPYAVTLKNLSNYTQNVYCTGCAVALPEVADGKFAKKEWDYTPMCGNMCFYLKYSPSGAPSTKFISSAGNKTVFETDWYAKYRAQI